MFVLLFNVITIKTFDWRDTSVGITSYGAELKPPDLINKTER